MNATSLEELRAAQAAAEQSQSQELAPSPAAYPDDTRMEKERVRKRDGYTCICHCLVLYRNVTLNRHYIAHYIGVYR